MCLTQISFTQFQRYDALLAEEAEEGKLEELAMIEGAMVEFLEDVDNDDMEITEGLSMLSPGDVKPSYATIFKQGTKSEPPGEGICSSGSCTQWHPSHREGAHEEESCAPQEKKDVGRLQVVLGQYSYVPPHVCQVVFEKYQGNRGSSPRKLQSSSQIMQAKGGPWNIQDVDQRRRNCKPSLNPPTRERWLQSHH